MLKTKGESCVWSQAKILMKISKKPKETILEFYGTILTIWMFSVSIKLTEYFLLKKDSNS